MKLYPIVAVTAGVSGVGRFEVLGDFTAVFRGAGPGALPATTFIVDGSTGNDGQYTCDVDAVFTGPNTEITVAQTIVDATADGDITNTSAYYIDRFGTDPDIVVRATDTNITDSDLTLLGRINFNFGEDHYNNLVKVMQSFANPTAPANPSVGQLWCDTTAPFPASSNLKIWNGIGWLSVGLTAPSGFFSYVHVEAVAATTWNVNHNFNLGGPHFCDLNFNVYVDTGGSVFKPILPADVTFVDADNLTITFTVAYAGRAVFIKA